MSTNSFPHSHSPQATDPHSYLQHDRWTRQQVEGYQAKALQACREYAYAHSPFYQRFHQGLTDCPLHELPVLTKAMLMQKSNAREGCTSRPASSLAHPRP